MLTQCGKAGKSGVDDMRHKDRMTILKEEALYSKCQTLCVPLKTHFIWISGRYVATLVDELKHVLSGWSETTACECRVVSAQNHSRSHCVLQQLHTTTDFSRAVKHLILYTLIQTVVRENLYLNVFNQEVQKVALL